VASLGPSWVAWAEEHLRPAKTRDRLRLRPWQKYVLERGLEVDSSGRLVWSTVAVSAPRQLGKSWLMLALAMARLNHAEAFGEQQRVVHTASRLRQAYRIQQQVWSWAESRGYHVSRAVDSAAVTQTADGSAWLISSLAAVWGETATMAFVDEAWDVEPEVVEDGIEPILADPEQSQLWLFSAANLEATATYPRVRRRATAGGGDGQTLVLEWSADPAADPLDPATWRSATPWWTPSRERFLAVKARQRGFSTEYLNLWPNVGAAASGWPVGWVDLGSGPREPPRGLLGAVECSPDRRRFGIAVAELVGGRVSVWTRSFDTVAAAVAQLRSWAPSVVLCGVTLAGDVSGAWQLEPVGTKETGWATPRFSDLVGRGQLVHDHDPGMVREVETARVSITEAGPVVSARRSEGPVPTVKAACWASWAVVDGRFAAVSAEIW
jgi:hypothetical protein